MGYRHGAVRSLAHEPFDGAIGIICSKARDAEWGYWLDGVPVVKELHEYGMALRQVSPSIKFMVHVDMNVWVRGFGQASAAHEVCVCMPTSPYAVCSIGYHIYREKTDGPAMYMVFARGITNEKYSSNREQSAMKLTGNIKIALRNALAQLIPYRVEEVAKLEYDLIHSKSVASGQKKAGQLPTLLGAVSGQVLLNEIRALRAMGVTFTTLEFNAVVEGMDEAVQLANAERSKRVDAVMVSFVERGGVMWADCVETGSVRTNYYFRQVGEAVTYAMADVPQFIVEKVSVLQTLGNRQHIDSVGMKIDDKLFWVEK
jgi:hypothetical protein